VTGARRRVTGPLPATVHPLAHSHPPPELRTSLRPHSDSDAKAAIRERFLAPRRQPSPSRPQTNARSHQTTATSRFARSCERSSADENERSLARWARPPRPPTPSESSSPREPECSLARRARPPRPPTPSESSSPREPERSLARRARPPRPPTPSGSSSPREPERSLARQARPPPPHTPSESSSPREPERSLARRARPPPPPTPSECSLAPASERSHVTPGVCGAVPSTGGALTRTSRSSDLAIGASALLPQTLVGVAIAGRTKTRSQDRRGGGGARPPAINATSTALPGRKTAQ